MTEDLVVLVDENDKEIGTMPKLMAHEKGVLHRAISVFIFSTDGKWLLQQRALHKYHSPGLWSNTSCSHPYQNETVSDAAHRRLKEEMGMACKLEKAFDFIYKAELDQGLTEHELDHVFIGITNDISVPNPDEVHTSKYLSFEELDTAIQSEPAEFTEWFKLIYKRVQLQYKTHPM